jgi:hypothetical protein
VRAFRLKPLVPGAAVAWLVTLVMASAGVVGVAVARTPSSAGELAFIFPLVMSLPFAFTAAFVLLPVMSLAAAVTGGRLWAMAAAGVVAAPLQVIALLVAGRVLFRGPHMRPTLADDIAAVLGHPSPQIVAMLLALAAGGLTFALMATRRRALHLTSQ